MNAFFRKNLNNKGRLVRGILAVALFIAAFCALRLNWWLPILLAIGGVFTAFEALRGWCVMRACGIKTLV